MQCKKVEKQSLDIVGGLLGFPSDERMGSARSEEMDNW